MTGLGDIFAQTASLSWDGQRLFTSMATIMTGIGFLFTRDA